MASGVAAVWVPVEDMSRAVTFYRDVLGLEVTSEQEEWSELDANGLKIGLNVREATAPQAAGGAVLTFQPDGDDIEAEVQRLEAAGTHFSGGISDHPFGRIVPFKDTEGNDLQLYSPPQG